MESIAVVLAFVARRMRDSWRFQLVIAAGILVAAILMAATSIYTRAVSDLSLTVTLRNQLEDRRQVFAVLPGTPLSGSGNAAAREYIEQSVSERFGELESGRRRYITTGPLGVDQAPRPRSQVVPYGTFASLEGALDHVTLVEGRLPGAPRAQHSDALGGITLTAPLEVVIPAVIATDYGIEPGHTFNIRDGFDECDREPDPPPGGPPPPPRPPCQPTLHVERVLPVVVTGTVVPDDPQSQFWTRVPRRMTALYTGGPRAQIIPLFVSTATFDQYLSPLIGQFPVNTTWISEINTDLLNVAVLEDTRATFDILRADLRSMGGHLVSPIESRLDSFTRDLSFAQAPILLLLAQVVGIALFYIVVVSGVLVAQRREELFSMRSRGASLFQVLGLTAIEGMVLAVVSAIIGPLIAAGVISLLGYTAIFAPLTGGRAIDVTLTDDAFLLAAGGAIVAVVFMLVPLTIASRTRVLSERLRGLTRPSGPNALQRYYLDVALVLVAAGLIFEADLRGTVFERNSVGGLSADPLLLSTPILFALAAALVILRILPWAYRLIAWITYDRFPLSIAATLRYVSRTVGPAARLTILLMLGAALGTFAASYADTIDRSLTERILYDTGVEHRVALADGAYSSPAGVERRLNEAEGIDRLSAVHRSGVAAGRSIGTASAVNLLAIEPRDARAMMWFREDLSELTFDELMRSIDVPPTGRGVGVPDDTETLRLWMDLTEGDSEQTIWIRVRDGNGRFFTAGQIDVPDPALGWTPIDVEFGRQIIGAGAVAPYSLHSIVLSEPFGVFVSEPAIVRIDAVTAITEDGRELIVEDFEDRGWVRFRQRREAADRIEFVEAEDAVSGAHVMEFSSGIGQSPGLRAMHFADPSICTSTRCTVPMIISQDFAERQRLDVGDRFTVRMDLMIVRGRVAAIVALFPTLRPDEKSFIVADYDALFHLGAITALRPSVSPTEVWLDLTEDPEALEATMLDLRRSRYSLRDWSDRDDLLFEQGRDPLTTAGGSGILLVAFIAISLLLALAFLVSMAVAARQRRLEMALLRTFGIGNLSILIQVFLEYAIIIGSGLALGVVLGNRISLLLLAYLEIDERGRHVLPPFQIETDWQILGVAFGVLVAVLVFGVVATWRWYLNLELNRELRLTN